MKLHESRCKACAPGTPPLDSEAISSLLAQVPHWKVSANGVELSRLFTFASYEEGLAFVNAVAGLAVAEDHHPEIELGYKKVKLRFSTHSIGGLSQNDFICAAKVDQIKP